MRCKYLSSTLTSWGVIYFAMISISPQLCFADDDVPKSVHPEISAFDNLEWQEVAIDKQINIFEMLASQTKGNYTKLHTWKGACLVHVENAIGESFGVQYLNLQNTGPLIQIADLKLNFIVDIPSSSYFRSKENSKMIMLEEETKNVVDLPQVHSINDRSVVTPEHYIQFDPDTLFPGFHILQGFPETENKRTAFRRPAAYGQNQSEGELVDPLAFFGFSPGQKFWEGLGLYTPLLKGEGSAELVNKAKERVSVFQADTKDGVSYKIVMKLDDDNSFYSSSIWSSSVGFNPVSLVLSESKNGDNLFHYQEWKWQTLDGIFIPTYFSSATYDRTSEKLTNQRTIKFEDSVLNQPIDENQFSYQGLGMDEGELVKDEIENAFYIINDGGLKKIANFGNKYVPPGKVKDQFLSSRQWMLILNLIFLITLVTFVWFKCRKTEAN